MSSRRRHGSGPPHRPRDTADTGPVKVDHRRTAAARRKQRATFLTTNPNARLVPDHACGKTRYANANAARTALALIVRNADPGQQRIPVRTYPCSGCQGWHLTSWPTPHSGAPQRPGEPNPS